jgi:HK97 family phage major capsid protein
MKKHELEDEIVVLQRRIDNVKRCAASAGRPLNSGEKQLIEGIRDQIDETEMKIMSMPEEALTRPGSHLGESSRISNRTGGFSSLGEQLQAVMRAETPGGKTDPRLYNAASGLNETTPSDGGFLVQQDFSTQLLEEAFQTGQLINLCRRFPVSGNSIKFPMFDETSRVNGSRLGAVQSYYADEAEQYTGSKPKFRSLELTLKKLIGMCYVTDEIVADTRVLEAVVRQAFVSEINFKVDDGIVNGTGAGQPLGIVNAPCLVTVDKETGQPAASVVLENITSMWSRLLPGSQRTAVWLVNVDVLPQLYSMSLAVGTGGGPVFLPGGGVSDAPFATLFSRPILPLEQCQSCGTVGDIILADLQGYVIAEKAGGIQMDQSIHVRFDYGEQVFRFQYRWDGQPILASAVTPYKGANDLSHFIALQTRD